MPEVFVNIILVSIIIILVGIYVYVAIDLPRRHFLIPREKRNWMLLITLLPVIGAILYIISNSKKKL